MIYLLGLVGNSGEIAIRISRRQLSVLGLAQAATLGLAGEVRAATAAAAGCGPHGPGDALFEDPEFVPPPPPLVGQQGLLDGAAKGIWCADSGGTGPAVVLLHAHTGTAESWAYQHGALAAAGYRAITYSRRGAGQSAPPVADRTDLPDLIAVLDALGVARAHLVGIAAGGFIGVRAVAEQSRRLASFTLCCSMGGMTDPAIQARTAPIHPPEFNALPVDMRELSPSYRLANPEGMARWMAIYRESLSARMASLPAEVREAMRKEAMSGGIPLESVAAGCVPMHLIYGDADLYAPPALARMLGRKLGNVGVSTIPEAGHSANWEMPRTFNAALLAYLATR